MFDQFHAKNPVHPIAAFACSMLALMVGMVCSRTPYIFAYAGVLAVVFLSYGFYMAVTLLTLGMGVFGVVAGGISALINGTLDMFWITPARCILIGVCVVPLLSVPPAQLTRALNQLKFPRMLTLGMLITIRFVPIVFGEIRQIRDAMRSRGIDTRWWSIRAWAPKQIYRAFIVPLVMRVVGISDTLSLSVETRGFDAENQNATVYKPVVFTGRDGLFIALVVLASLAMLTARFILHL